MNPNAYQCAICQTYRSENDAAGLTPFGDPVCGWCRETFDTCGNCGGIYDARYQGSKLDRCCVCAPIERHQPSNRTSIRRHPILKEADKLDAEYIEAMRRTD